VAGTVSFHGARIWTGNPRRPWASSIRIVDGVVAGLDGPPRPGSIDARGRVILPGIIDAHTHFLMGGLSLGELDLSGVRSREAFEKSIEERHAILPQGEWLIARGWQSENWSPPVDPDRSWLRAAGDRPTVCYRMDHHAAVVNDAVLSKCDLSHEPPGGRIARDPHTREATGLMVESAAWRLVNPLIPEPPDERKRAALLAAAQHAHAFGLTTVGSMEYSRDVREVFAPLRDGLSMRVRVTLLDRDWPPDFSFGESFECDDRLAVIGCKAFIDGTLGSRTARMLEDYDDDPGNRGMFVERAAEDRLNEWAVAVATHGLQPAMHAIGDEAARAALDAIDAVEAACPDVGVRPRVEHAQQIALADIGRFRGRIASMQPLHRADDCRYARRRVGARRIGGTFAFRRLAEAGAILAFGSDWPVVTCDPIAGIRAAVTALTLDGRPFEPDQALTVEEALTACTRNAAYALRCEERIGSLEPGKCGDLVMLDRDPFEADWVNAPPRVQMTVAGGRVVYDAARE
jgi:predicted amidohydrolase YtcJ